jgi:hypothetical protein
MTVGLRFPPATRFVLATDDPINVLVRGMLSMIVALQQKSKTPVSNALLM